MEYVFEVIDKKIQEARERKWQEEKGDFSDQGIRTAGSFKECLEDLAKKRSKPVARLTEQEFSEICQDNAAIKEWRIENFYPKFEEDVLAETRRGVYKEAGWLVEELGTVLEQQLSTVEAARRLALDNEQLTAGMPPEVLRQFSASFVIWKEKIKTSFQEVVDKIERDRNEAIDKVQKFMQEIGRAVKDPANREDVDCLEDVAGYVGLSGKLDFFGTGEGGIVRKFTAQEFAEEINLELNPFKGRNELVEIALRNSRR